MGKEQTCIAVIDGVRTEGRALLETDEILFRGEPRLKLPLADIRTVQVRGEDLVVRHKAGAASFTLGSKQAAAWAKRITAPPSVVDKLGIGPQTSVVALKIGDAALLAAIKATAGAMRLTRRGKPADVVLLGAQTTADLKALAGLETLIHPAGAVWVVYPKGRQEIREAEVLGTARAGGWKDNKTCRVSDTDTALRFVIPVARRPKPAKRP